MDKIIKIPQLPISGNHYYGDRAFNGRVIKFITKKGKDFKKLVQTCTDNSPPFTTPVSLTVVMYMGDKRKRDIDNFIGKSLLDALKGLAYVDDSQIWEKHSYKRLSSDKQDMTYILVEEIDLNEVEPQWKNLADMKL